MSISLIALIVLGLALVVFGGFVLLRHSDRPGGTIKWLGVEVSSTGAGLPLIVLGIGCVVVAANAAARPDDARNGSGTTRDSAAAVAGTDTTTPGANANSTPNAEDGQCLDDFVAALPEERVATVEAGMRDLTLIHPHQPLDQPFAIVLTDGGTPIGALRMRLYPGPTTGADLYRVEQVVDAGCHPVTALQNTSRGGNPRELVNWDTLRMRLGDRAYDLRIGGEGDIGVGYFRRVL